MEWGRMEGEERWGREEWKEEERRRREDGERKRVIKRGSKKGEEK